ncbi:methyltransferase type 11 [Mesorhizobium sp. M4B.F.Ca.ET.215.01.1.1]|uniref:small ribosomal subunit Rsm22 family protein n=8 Tax=Phyllobacteriaceae TaxID=69277 RepID=UPI000FCCB3F8|nr:MULTISPECIES: small ribosomal subunit Rsm22 family protein [unclassified Mesorhizobium]RUW69791.1 methyltransferase type 11 [Mesorhizobium sp. M4B.F.Ca.ET.049.02.1.2]TGQ13132.1 methyltransferase type 11 [Mesorhizobium sp. M4B.F.Ca.ET.215.01.1.1]TGQ43444.1 methyltransferase type 11 [Mesorhizobium sp. M4B.F.Ca.ET.214.01.1.1]TGQ46249.1 methyltransferase type 11 [Mesorhizobium sp. M00.F.Ca.ET.220.01.1.1]TGQ62259.1 methyltransferase type 11 [Mesorhizobium sp. M4B.F.Ca.ET.211.01.1.1]
MELPAPLRQGVERLLENVPLPALKQAARTLSDRYRAELRDGRLHMAEDMAVKAYLATRLPATYAAVRASLDALAEARPEFQPRTLLDIGAGPGTMLWATIDLWSDLEAAVMLEASAAVRKIGQTLAAETVAARTEWLAGDATIDLTDLQPADLVTAAYVLDEIVPASLPKLVGRLWQLTADTLLIVEPGTPAGWQRILAVRRQLIEAGAHVLAPCPHEAPCPLVPPDWCHFSRRVARSRLHRLAKDADVPWEDEKFIYIAASRQPAPARPARVIAPPKAGSGKVLLKLCVPDGSAGETLFSKRDGDAFRISRRLDWGDTLDI